MLFVTSQTLNLGNQYLLCTHTVSANMKMIAIQCITVPRRRRMINTNGNRRGKHRDAEATLTRKDLKAIAQRIENKASLLCKSAHQSMTKRPVSLSGRESAESVVMSSFNATQVQELHCDVGTMKDSVINKTYLLLDDLFEPDGGVEFHRSFRYTKWNQAACTVCVYTVYTVYVVLNLCFYVAISNIKEQIWGNIDSNVV